MTHICETDQNQCVTCLKFERDKFRARLSKSEEKRLRYERALEKFVNSASLKKVLPDLRGTALKALKQGPYKFQDGQDR